MSGGRLNAEECNHQNHDAMRARHVYSMICMILSSRQEAPSSDCPIVGMMCKAYCRSVTHVRV